MHLPTLEQLEEIRKTGFKPTIATYFIHEKKLLLYLKREYRIWMIPQAGIDQGLDTTQTMEQKMREEINPKFFDSNKAGLVLFHADRLEFAKDRQGYEKMKLQNATEIDIIGKLYIYFYCKVTQPQIEIANTKFDEYFWVDVDEAKYLISNSYLASKNKLLINGIDMLEKQGILR